MDVIYETTRKVFPHIHPAEKRRLLFEVTQDISRGLDKKHILNYPPRPYNIITILCCRLVVIQEHGYYINCVIALVVLTGLGLFGKSRSAIIQLLIAVGMEWNGELYYAAQSPSDRFTWNLDGYREKYVARMKPSRFKRFHYWRGFYQSGTIQILVWMLLLIESITICKR